MPFSKFPRLLSTFFACHCCGLEVSIGRIRARCAVSHVLESNWFLDFVSWEHLQVWLVVEWGKEKNGRGGACVGTHTWYPPPQGSKRRAWRLAGKSLLCSQSRLLSPCLPGSYRHPAFNLSRRPSVLSYCSSLELSRLRTMGHSKVGGSQQIMLGLLTFCSAVMVIL